MSEKTQDNLQENAQNTLEEISQDITQGFAYDMPDSYVQPDVPQPKPTSNSLAGFIGALIGSLIGVVVWVLIYKLGFIAGIAGAVTALCAMKGYKILGKVMNKKGVILSIIVTVVMIYVANRIAWAWEIFVVYTQDFGEDITFLDAFLNVDIVVGSSGLTVTYYKDLIIGYVLTACASYRTIINAFRESK